MNNIDLKGYMGFALTFDDSSLESQRLLSYCLRKDIKLIRIPKNKQCPIDYIPCGSVEWCSLSFDIPLFLDYYPEWCKEYLHRKVWYTEKFPYDQECFIKPASRYKRFTGFIKPLNSWKGKKRKEQYWCSEIIKFKNEWRYYISKGKVLCNGWYWGDEVNTPNAPELNINIPEDYFGALDFGTLYDGRLALVESQHPFACGWYGNQDYDYLYFQWLIDGWDYMLKNYCFRGVLYEK